MFEEHNIWYFAVFFAGEFLSDRFLPIGECANGDSVL